MPLLMDFQPVIMPNLWYYIRNFINVYTIIQPFFDPEFTINSFLEGAKQALVLVSSHLANGDIDALNGLVTEEAINEIRKNITLFSASQRESLRIKMDDIFRYYLYNIGIIMNDEKRFVEITVIFCCTRQMSELQRTLLSDTKPPPNFNDIVEKIREEGTVCNYRFIREYTKGVDSGWTINQLNHFRSHHF